MTTTENATLRTGIEGPYGQALIWGAPFGHLCTHWCPEGDHQWGHRAPRCIAPDALTCEKHVVTFRPAP